MFYNADGSDEKWFNLGRVGVSSTVLVVLAGALGVLASVFVPMLPFMLGYFPGSLESGQVWRLFTWPLPASTNLLWSILTLLMLWYFGSDLERALGRNKMMRLYGGMWLAMTLAGVFVGFLMPTSVYLVGLGEIQFAVLLLWIAENPTRPFFFGIPAWVVGAVLVAIEVLQYVQFRLWGALVAFLLGFLGIAVVARRMGLLSAYPWLPGAPRRRTVRRPARPTAAQRKAAGVEERIDQLLEKISRNGIHSLTRSERNELEKLRQKRQR